MEKNTIHVALDNSKRKLVVAILRPGATEPEAREIPKDPPQLQRLFRRLEREGFVQALVPAAKANNSGAGSGMSSYLSESKAASGATRTLPPTMVMKARRSIIG